MSTENAPSRWFRRSTAVSDQTSGSRSFCSTFVSQQPFIDIDKLHNSLLLIVPRSGATVFSRQVGGCGCQGRSEAGDVIVLRSICNEIEQHFAGAGSYWDGHCGGHADNINEESADIVDRILADYGFGEYIRLQRDPLLGIEAWLAVDILKSMDGWPADTRSKGILTWQNSD